MIDLVSAAGIDISDWANYKNGHKNPGANPQYCYEWAFVDPGVQVVLNLWHETMREVNGGIEQRINFRGTTARQETNGPRKARRERMEKAVAHAYRFGLPVRVIVLDGVRQATDHQPSRVSARLLDPLPWAVTKYNDATGEAVLRRGFVSSAYADQFYFLPSDGKSETHEVTTTVHARDTEVRRYALQRAKGKCQYCGAPGFQLSNGSTFLETHHVVPLSEGGPDSVGNVVALCPNHHREAHYGSNAKIIRKYLLNVLTGKC